MSCIRRSGLPQARTNALNHRLGLRSTRTYILYFASLFVTGISIVGGRDSASAGIDFPQSKTPRRSPIYRNEPTFDSDCVHICKL